MSKKIFKTIATVATLAVAVAAAIPSGGTSLLAVAAAGIGTSAAVLSGAALALSLGTSMLFRPKAPSTSASSADRLSVSLDPRTPRKFVLGRTAMATDIRDQEFSNNQEYLHRFVVTSSHKASAIEEIWFDDKKAWSSTGGVTSDFAGYLTVTPILEGSAANAINLSARMGATRRYTGLSYVYFRFKLTGNSKKAESPFAQSIPTRVTIIGKGAPTYDPRLDSTVAGGSGAHRAADQTTWVWNDAASRNPALQLLWYLLGWRIKNPATNEWRLAVGKGIPAARIDLASFITAANLCDEPVTLAAGGTQPRYRSDGVFSEADATGTVLDQLKAAMNAELDDVDGKIRITVLHNDLATPIADFNDDDILGGFTWDQTAPLDETYNVVRGTFIDPSTTSLYQAVDFPEVRIDSLDGIDRIETVDFQTVQDASQAQRLVKQRIARMLYSGRFTATFSYRAWKVQKNDVIRLTFGALGWTNKLFRVIETAVQVDGQVPMVLQVENADIYLWDRDERAAIQPVQPTSYDPYLNPIYQDVVEPKYADGTVIDELRPAEPGATNGASPEEKDLLAELDADVAQAEIDIAAAQQTIADLQTDAAATQAALTQAQNDIQAQGDEILAAQDDIIANASAISTVSNTVSAQGSSITTLQQTVSGQAGSISTLQQTVATQGGSITTLQQNVTTLQGSVSTLQQTVSTQGSSISQNSTAITTLQGNYASLSSTVSAQGSSITQLQTASSTQAGQIAALTTSVTAAGRPNLVSGGGFENGLTDWSYTAGGFNVTSGYGFGQYAYTGSFSGAAVRVLQKAVRAEAGVQYTLSADMSFTVNSGGGQCYIDMIFRNSSGGQLADTPQVARTSTKDFDSTGASRDAHKVTYTAPANTFDVLVRFVVEAYAGGNVQGAVRQIKLEGGANATPFTVDASVVQSFTALSTTTSQLASLQTTVSTQGTAITANATAITTLQSNLATLTTRVSAGGSNRLPNGGLEDGFNSGITSTGGFSFNQSSTWGRTATTSATGVSAFQFAPVPVTAGVTYTLSCDPILFGGASTGYVDFIGLDAGGGAVWDSTQVTLTGPFDFDTTTGRRGQIANTQIIPAGLGISSVICRFVCNVLAGNICGFRQMKLEQGPTWTPYSNEASVAQSFAALSTLTTQYASLSTTVGTQGVTITQQQTAITTINGNVTTLFGRAAVTLDVNGRVTGWETNNNGQVGDFTIRSDRFRVIPPGGSGSDGFYVDIDGSNRTTQYILSGGVRVVEIGWLA